MDGGKEFILTFGEPYHPPYWDCVYQALVNHKMKFQMIQSLKANGLVVNKIMNTYKQLKHKDDESVRGSQENKV